MPQPIKIHKGLKKGRVEWGIDSLKQRPALAAHIGLIAGMSQHMEIAVGRVLGAILGTEAEVAVAMYFSLTGDAAKKEVLETAARTKLSNQLFAEFAELLKSIKGPRGMRNDVVHGIWAVSDERPDSLILINRTAWAKHISTYGSTPLWVKRHSSMSEAELKRSEETFNAFMKSWLEYTETDFLDIQSAISKAMGDLNDFHAKVWPLSYPQQPDIAPPTT